MKYDFDQIIDRRNTFSTKWDSKAIIKDFGMDIDINENTIPVFTADMDFRCAQPIIDALVKVAQRGIYGYTSDRCSPEYAQAVCRWFRDRHDWEIDPESITYVNGTIESLKIALEAFTKPGDGVVITYPVYGPFHAAVESLGRRIVNVPLKNDNEYYTMDFPGIEQALRDPNNTMFAFCSPNNPTGRVWSAEELQTLSKLCLENNVLIVSDEVHCDIVRKGVKHHPIASVADPANIIALTAVNKSFNVAGLQCSNAIIPDPKLREVFRRVGGMRLPSPFAVAATIAAYTEGDEWLEQVCDYLDGNIDFTLAFLAEHMPEVKTHRPEGTYTLWMNFGGYGLSPEEIHHRIYYNANVCLEDGTYFDPAHGAIYQRICLPTRRALIREALERIAAEFPHTME